MNLLAAAVGSAAIAGTADEPATNLQIFRDLAASVAAEVSAAMPSSGAGSDSGSLALAVIPNESGWFLQDTVARVFAATRKVLDGAADAAYKARLGILDLRVAYADIRTDGFLGPRIVDRRLTLSLEANIVRQTTGAVVVSRRLDREYADTVPLSEVVRLESSTLPFTRGALPQEGWFSTFIEPVIVLGAIAVAVLLLFSVRS